MKIPRFRASKDAGILSIVGLIYSIGLLSIIYIMMDRNLNVVLNTPLPRTCVNIGDKNAEQ